jgi:potassium efflux system protein
MKRTPRIVTCALLAAVFAAGGRPAVAQQPPDPSKPEAPAAAVPSEKPPAGEQIQAKIKEIEAAKDLDAKLKSDLLDSYRQAQAHLEDAQRNAAAATAYRKALESAPALAGRIRDEVKQMAAGATAPALADVPESASAKELEQPLAKEQAQLSAFEKKLEGLESQLKNEQSRPNKARQELTGARVNLDKVQDEIKSEAPKDEAPALDEAHRLFLEARKRALTSRVDMLEQELLSYDARIDLLSAQREETVRQVAGAEAHSKALQDLVNKRRREEAEQARLEGKTHGNSNSGHRCGGPRRRDRTQGHRTAVEARQGGARDGAK